MSSEIAKISKKWEKKAPAAHFCDAGAVFLSA
jgi:hypothetical protein